MCSEEKKYIGIYLVKRAAINRSNAFSYNRFTNLLIRNPKLDQTRATIDTQNKDKRFG